MYSKAGLFDEEFDSPSVLDAIDADATLTPDQKKVLLDLYRTLSRANGLAAEEQ
jgi:hypothetical protein